MYLLTFTYLLVISFLVTITAVQSQNEDPFADETNQCQINVSPEMMKSLSDSMQAEIKCDDLWNNLLLQFHHTRQNLTECQERAATESTTDNAYNFCQLLLDDAQRQMEQEHRKYAAGMEEKLHAAQQETQKQRNAKDALQRELNRLIDSRNELYLDLLLANIAIGETKVALSYYALQPTTIPSEKLHEQIVRSVYRVTLYQDERLINLINFIRGITNLQSRLSLFRLTKTQILKRPTQRYGYMAAVFAQNILEDLPVYNADILLYSELAYPLVKHWKEQLVNGNFKEVAEFATRQPKYFQQMQINLATVDQKQWSKIQFDKFVPYVNALPQAAQRLEVLRQTARQFDICEQFINKGKVDQAVKKTLEVLRNEFGTFTRGKNYKFYLDESRKKSG